MPYSARRSMEEVRICNLHYYMRIFIPARMRGSCKLTCLLVHKFVVKDETMRFGFAVDEGIQTVVSGMR